MGILYCFILWCAVSKVCCNDSVSTSGSSKKGPGPSSCLVYGKSDYINSTHILTPDKLPKECSSYFWLGIYVNIFYNYYNVLGDVSEEYLDLLLQSKKPVFISYGYDDMNTWALILACNSCNGTNVKDSLAGFQTFLNRHKNIAGLMLYNFDITPGLLYPENFSENLASYIKQMKNGLPNMEIGLYLNSSAFIAVDKDSTIRWLQFSILNEIVDFYVILLYPLIRCTEDFKIGVEPVSGESEYTIGNIQFLINKSGIPKDKIIFQYFVTPFYSVVDDVSTVNYQTMCTNPNTTMEWCADTIETFYEKGVFARCHASGFLVNYVDWDDVFNDCKCSQSFSSFYAILSGFNQAQKPAPCKLFDRT